jgi:DNA polymerase-4
VAEDLRRKGYRGRCVGVKLRYADFRTVTRDCTLAEPNDDPDVIVRAARQCLRRVPLDQRLRLLGVRVAALSPVRVDSAPSASPQQELPLSV